MAEPPGLPYTRHEIDASDEASLLQALHGERLTQGTEVSRFEAAITERTGSAHAVCVPSGTVALELALEALGAGPGDEVLVPPISFVATANAVVRAGATPVFVDVEPATGNLDAERVAAACGERCVGAIAVHYAGRPADTDAIRAALGERRFLLEDACHALGATRGGRSAGALGDAATFSFHPAKGVTCAEGGAVTTSDGALAMRVRALRDHGLVRDPRGFRGLGLPSNWDATGDAGLPAPWIYEQHGIGTNGRLSDLNAALGRSQIQRLGGMLERRRARVERYRARLGGLEGVRLPPAECGLESAWHLFVIRVTNAGREGFRRLVFDGLRARGIGAQVHYIPIHLQPYYRERFGTRLGDCPVAEAFYRDVISLPLFASMDEDAPDRVADALIAALRDAS